MKYLAVAGAPILHSRSPQLFSLLLDRSGIPASYGRLAADSAAAVLDMALDLKIVGLNITSPFKQTTAPLLASLDPAAEKIGAVNTLIRRDGSWHGFNTDPAGVIAPLLARSLPLAGMPCLVLGAGGAARAAVHALQSQGASVTVVNRTLEKARDLAADLHCSAESQERLKACLERCELLVNTIPCPEEVIVPSWLPPGIFVMDANYGEDFLERQCRKKKLRFASGREWLVHQALLSYSLFFPTSPSPPPAEEVIASLSPKRTPVRNVSLIGFMGSGKSEVGRALARQLGFHFLDSDDQVEKREKMPIAQIFSSRGEASFRRREREVLSTLGRMRKSVLACGGGAVQDEVNRRRLRRHSLVVWLWAPLDVLLPRTQSRSRPLLEGAVDRRREAERLLAGRKAHYFEAADMIVDSRASVEATSAKIAGELRRILP